MQLAVEEIVLTRQQAIELLPRAPAVIEAQVYSRMQCCSHLICCVRMSSGRLSMLQSSLCRPVSAQHLAD